MKTCVYCGGLIAAEANECFAGKMCICQYPTTLSEDVKKPQISMLARLAEVEKELAKEREEHFLWDKRRIEQKNELETQLLDEKASRKNWQYMCEVAMEELKLAREVVEACKQDSRAYSKRVMTALEHYDAALGKKEG